MSEVKPAIEMIEPSARRAMEKVGHSASHLTEADAQSYALLSIAISLKRLTDAVVGDAYNSGAIDLLRDAVRRS